MKAGDYVLAAERIRAEAMERPSSPSIAARILGAMKKPREVIQPRWGVYLLKRKAERLPFTVTARDSEEAIKRALEEHDIPERERFRISVQRET
jgi:hypothetical protein